MRNAVNVSVRAGAMLSLVLCAVLVAACIVPVAPLPEPVYVEGQTTVVTEAPAPAPAASSSSRQLADYYYYPDAEVYYNPSRRYYYWYTDGDWRYGPMLPGWIQLSVDPVRLRLLAGRPYYRHSAICQRYGYSKKRYYYYPHAEVYFNPGIGVWFWYRNGDWHSGFSLPGYINIDYRYYVETDLRYSRPYYRHRDIRHRYPPTGSYSRRSMPRIPSTAPPSYVPAPPPGLRPPGSGSGSGRTGTGPGPHGGSPGSGSSPGTGTFRPGSPPSGRPGSPPSGGSGTSPPGLTPPTSGPGGSPPSTGSGSGGRATRPPSVSPPSVSPPSTGSGSGGRTTRPPSASPPSTRPGSGGRATRPPSTELPDSGVRRRFTPPASTPTVPERRVTPPSRVSPPTGSGGSTGSGGASAPSRTQIRPQRRVELPRREAPTPNTDTGVNRPVQMNPSRTTPVLPPNGAQVRPDAGASHATPGRLAPTSQFPATPGATGTPNDTGQRPTRTGPGRR